MRLLGYTRVSTVSQDAHLQLDALTAVGVEPRDVFSDVTSGVRAAIKRPGMQKLLDYATTGDTVVVWRIDRLGRSLPVSYTHLDVYKRQHPGFTV